jgi:hypothetical protein
MTFQMPERNASPDMAEAAEADVVAGPRSCVQGCPKATSKTLGKYSRRFGEGNSQEVVRYSLTHTNEVPIVETNFWGGGRFKLCC